MLKTEIINNYSLTNAYKDLKNEIDKQIQIGNLNCEEGKNIIFFAASTYERYVNNGEHSNSIKICLQQNPVPMSVLDIIKFQKSCSKQYFIVFEKDKKETQEIFLKFNISPAIFEIKVDNALQIVFVFVEEFTSQESYKNREEHIGHRIFHEIERHMIPLDYFFYSWNITKKDDMFWGVDDGKINPSFILIGMRGKRENETDGRNNRSGYRKDIDFAFRSSWEANIARIFNHKHINWQYEKKNFFLQKDGKRIESLEGAYLPDFFLDDNTIIEVKGFWQPISRNRAKFFTQQYPEYNYLIIDQDMYFNLKTKYKSIIPEWEEDGMTSVENEALQIVGLTVGMRKQTFKTLKVGDKVILQCDSQNTYDSNAIMALTIAKREIGFISADWAVIYAPKIDMGMTFDAEITSIEPKVIHIKVKRNNPEIEIVYDILK